MSNPSSGGISLSEPAPGIDWTIRPFRESDVPQVVSLINLARRTDGNDHVTDADHLRFELEGPHSDPSRDVIVVEGPSLPGALLGMGRVLCFDDEVNDQRVYSVRMYIHPAARASNLGDVIARRLVEMARTLEAANPSRRGAVWLDAFMQEGASALPCWRQLGLKEVRQFWVMARSLDTAIDEPLPVDGITLRPYRLPDDNEGARLAFNDSFADHWDFHPDSPEDWEHGITSAMCRPDLSLLAEVKADPGKIAGFCIVWVHDADNKASGRREAWIDLLGTVRAWRRKGLGRALLLEGLHTLKAAGYDTALLGVDSQSLTGANRLYESVGFRLRYREMQFKRALDAVDV